MDLNSFLPPLLGGMLIGLAVTIMLLFNGRVTGISGILSSALMGPHREGLWRWLFLGGIITGGVIMRVLNPAYFENLSGRGLGVVTLAGLLVGFGTVMGSGCTSGHGVCGISRFSVRSLVATITFMLFGILAVALMRTLTGGF